MAIACLVERAPCLPSRTCSISSRTNSPACVLGAFPCRLSLRARSSVFFSGIIFLKSRIDVGFSLSYDLQPGADSVQNPDYDLVGGITAMLREISEHEPRARRAGIHG